MVCGLFLCGGKGEKRCVEERGTGNWSDCVATGVKSGYRMSRVPYSKEYLWVKVYAEIRVARNM